MAGTGKTLTVSYGAFSCALDGFDDPLQIMTAILDYLRYLEAIAGDPGVAPGAPDIDILTGIATGGMDRQVDVQMQDGGIVLRSVPAQGAGAGIADMQAHVAQPVGAAVPGRTGDRQPSGGTEHATAARVLRVRGGDLARLTTYAARDHPARDGDVANPPDAIPRAAAPAPLSPEAERALQRELASITAGRIDLAARDKGVAARDTGLAAGDTARDAARSGPANADRRPQADARDDLARIFDETDGHLETAASSRRRNAIHYLRAAVAATRAETGLSVPPRRIGDGMTGRSGPLAAARLRRALASPHHAQAVPPADLATDALRLMSDDHRDGVQGAAPAQPDTPPEDFGAYAARMAATGLPDLIEAAAAYLVDIEGHLRFSRPMLMEKLDQIGVADVREDMLRACDRVLHEGNLRKCSDGRYATTDRTRFRAVPRAVSGQRS